jgi:hypothetical protein
MKSTSAYLDKKLGDIVHFSMNAHVAAFSAVVLLDLSEGDNLCVSHLEG